MVCRSKYRLDTVATSYFLVVLFHGMAVIYRMAREVGIFVFYFLFYQDFAYKQQRFSYKLRSV